MFKQLNTWLQRLFSPGSSSSEPLDLDSSRRLRLIETSNAVTRRILSRQKLALLLDDTVELIRNQFDDVYHAQVFLMSEDKRRAVLRASTGDIGQQLLKRKHSLEVGSQSVIGQVTLYGKHVVVSDRSPLHFFNELLFETRTELALPLRLGEQIIGALDIQSKHYNAFAEDDIEILQALADQIAIAIDNAQLVEELQRQAEENMRLYQREQESRSQIEQLNRELIGRAWQSYLSHDLVPLAQTIDLNTGEVTQPPGQTSISQQALARGAVVHQVADGQQQVAIPIRVSGNTVGVIEFDLPQEKQLSDLASEALQAIGERIGLVVDNIRLFEQSQRLSQRRAIINEINTTLAQTSSMQLTLETAAQQLREKLDVPSVSIALKPVERVTSKGQES
jgi:GAF domain-containing protein